MTCASPFFVKEHGILVPCGQCFGCRHNARRVWVLRMLLEATDHPDRAFVTLTYDNDHLPPGNTLVPRDLTLWLKRLRKAYAPKTLRYFACGEYGSRTGRAHYHAILFGIDVQTATELVAKTWTAGMTLVLPADMEALAYVAGYVTKKLKKRRDPEEGQHPEFIRTSRRPGLGANAARLCLDYASGLPPEFLYVGDSRYGLGRFLRQKVFELLPQDFAEKIKLQNIAKLQSEVKQYLPVGSHPSDSDVAQAIGLIFEAKAAGLIKSYAYKKKLMEAKEASKEVF